jgi:toxin ParE1/3/4
MSVPLVRSPQALQDLASQAEYLAQQRDGLGERFLTATEKAFELLMRFPGIGGRLETTNPRMRNIRAWPISEFPNHLVLYREFPDRVEIVRVVHAARDLANWRDV